MFSWFYGWKSQGLTKHGSPFREWVAEDSWVLWFPLQCSSRCPLLHLDECNLELLSKLWSREAYTWRNSGKGGWSFGSRGLCKRTDSKACSVHPLLSSLSSWLLLWLSCCVAEEEHIRRIYKEKGSLWSPSEPRVATCNRAYPFGNWLTMPFET
jgi:hypothetical protein